LPSTILHYTSRPKAAQNSKLINAERRPFHEECKTEFITYKQNKKIEKTHIKKIEAPSKLHDDQLSIVLALSASPNPRSPSSIRALHHPDAHFASVHTEKRRHILSSHRF